MKVFRHINGNLYTIQQIRRGRVITPRKGCNSFEAVPYKTNKNAPKLPSLGEEPNLEGFTLEFED